MTRTERSSDEEQTEQCLIHEKGWFSWEKMMGCGWGEIEKGEEKTQRA